MIRHRWKVVSTDNDRDPRIIETFFFWNIAIGFAAWYEIFAASTFEKITVERI